jgi:hypothetical protein
MARKASTIVRMSPLILIMHGNYLSHGAILRHKTSNGGLRGPEGAKARRREPNNLGFYYAATSA